MDEALALLDEWTALAHSRTIFTAQEVEDVLLDVRQALVRVPEVVPVPA